MNKRLIIGSSVHKEAYVISYREDHDDDCNGVCYFWSSSIQNVALHYSLRITMLRTIYRVLAYDAELIQVQRCLS
jgi:hypothetical protein